jgi:hypothetical protein
LRDGFDANEAPITSHWQQKTKKRNKEQARASKSNKEQQRASKSKQEQQRATKIGKMRRQYANYNADSRDGKSGFNLMLRNLFACIAQSFNRRFMRCIQGPDSRKLTHVRINPNLGRGDP